MTAAAPLEKIRALLARAVDSGASEEERRTSATIAAKLIRQHDVPIGAPLVVVEAVPAPVEPARTMIIRSKFDSVCRSCGDEVLTGRRVAWTKGRGVECLPCYRSDQ